MPLAFMHLVTATCQHVDALFWISDCHDKNDKKIKINKSGVYGLGAMIPLFSALCKESTEELYHCTQAIYTTFVYLFLYI